MDKTRESINKFVREWKNKQEVEGIVVTGSYALGLHSPKSDIDVVIVFSDNYKYEQRGNNVIDGVLIEYIAKPGFLWRDLFKENFSSGNRLFANMFIVGKILFDRNGRTKKIKQEAESYLKKKYKKMNEEKIEMAKYHLWDGLSKLKSYKNKDFNKYAPLYYLQLSKILMYYSRFTLIDMPATAKLYKFLNNNEFRGKYKLDGFKDKEFIYLVNMCLKKQSIKSIENLTNYVLDKLGGFDIDGWKIKIKL